MCVDTIAPSGKIDGEDTVTFDRRWAIYNEKNSIFKRNLRDTYGLQLARSDSTNAELDNRRTLNKITDRHQRSEVVFPHLATSMPHSYTRITRLDKWVLLTT